MAEVKKKRQCRDILFQVLEMFMCKFKVLADSHIPLLLEKFGEEKPPKEWVPGGEMPSREESKNGDKRLVNSLGVVDVEQLETTFFPRPAESTRSAERRDSMDSCLQLEDGALLAETLPPPTKTVASSLLYTGSCRRRRRRRTRL